MNDSYDSNRLTYLALGDSYTIGEGVNEYERWPVQLKESLGKLDIGLGDPVIIAKTGWRTDELKAAIMKDDDNIYDLVSLLIGVNDQYQERSTEQYKHEFDEVLSIAINKAGGKPDHVFVLSIPDYGYTPFGNSKKEKITAELNKFNEINRSITGNRSAWYFDITGLTRSDVHDPALLTSDNLHPSARQYRMWVEKIISKKDFINALKSF